MHVLSAMLWFGGSVFYSLTYHYLARNLERRQLFVAFEHIDRMGAPFFIASGIATLVFGAWNVATSEVWGFGDLWIVLGLAGLLIAFILGGAAGVPLTQRMNQLVAAERPDTEVYGALRSILAISWVENALLAAVVFVMVTKPGS
jgi:hypothetical protein